MALTNRRLAGLALLAVALIAVALLPPPVERRGGRRFFERQEHYYRLDRARREAVRRLEMLSNVEYLRAALRRTPGGSAPALVLDAPAAPAPVRRQILQSWDSLSRRLGPAASGARVALVLRVTDQSAYFTPATYFLPRATDGRTCAVLVEVAPQSQSLRLLSNGTYLRRALGPCVYYHALGQPGAKIEAWLLSASLTPAYDADWQGTEPRPMRSTGPVAAGGLEAIIQEQANRAYRASLEETACAAGRYDACGRALRGDDPFMRTYRWPALRAQGVVNRRGLLAWWGTPSVGHFMADLTRRFGRERATTFWTSPLGVDSAFATAFDVPLDRYTAAWLRGDERVRLGPLVSATSVVLSLLALVALVAGAAAWTTWRQVA